MILRDELESVVQKKKINEVYTWIHEHFFTSSMDQYITRCPFLIVQGPTGCAKTTTIECVANELKIPIREYSETTDTTSINFELAQNNFNHEYDDRSLDRRRANKFEHFVINHLRFNPLYLDANSSITAPSADSEFESESDEDLPPSLRGPKRPVVPGVIIHVEASLTFARSQKILMSTMVKIIKAVKAIAKTNPRRVAIIFENLDCEREVVSLPTKFKQTIGLQTIKFNPIIKSNMKKFIETRLKDSVNILMDKDTIDLLITDSDGDLGACLNTLKLIDSRVHTNHNSIFLGCTESVLKPLDNSYQVCKKQRLNPNRYKLNPSLMRDVTKSLGFFHTLGKIFYQKRLYPDMHHSAQRRHRSIDRPYKTENSTEYITSKLDLNPKILLTWLHQHYYKFCHPTNIGKASLFMDYLSDIDTLTLQSSQFYEMHFALEQQQLNLAIESTIYSLYEDQSKLVKSSHKKVKTNQGTFIIKSSVENLSGNGNGELYSFGKPESLNVSKVVDDRQFILNYLSNQLLKDHFGRVDPTNILVDYLPFLMIMIGHGCNPTNYNQVDGYKNQVLSLIENQQVRNLIAILGELGASDQKIDFDALHEKFIELIDRLEEEKNIRPPEFGKFIEDGN